jgi:hypothetical protein
MVFHACLAHLGGNWIVVWGPCASALATCCIGLSVLPIESTGNDLVLVIIEAGTALLGIGGVLGYRVMARLTNVESKCSSVADEDL